MSYDFYLSYRCETDDDVRRIVGDHKDRPYKELTSAYARVALLAPSMIERCKDYARSGHYKYGGGYKSLIQGRKGESIYTEALIRPELGQLRALGIYPPKVEVAKHPWGSFFLQFPFTLAKPCLSGGSEKFYVHENPLIKDAAFKIPMVQGSNWKGNMKGVGRLASKRGRVTKDVLERLFGNDLEDSLAETAEMRQGRLHFYPTFFDRIGLEVINPHSRKTKAGKNPIMIEVAPPGASGVFSLFYCPFDLVGEAEEAVVKQVREDLQFTCFAVEQMMRFYGFSAKRSKGYSGIQKMLRDKDGRAGYLVMSQVAEEPKENPFASFNELAKVADKIVSMMGGNKSGH
jgi:CRISPR-associated protein Cmr2